jgi:leader peptidase (prepilin peptidase)/N-methyltransferase
VSTGAAAAVAGVFGLLIGSFLNVVIHRLPRKESLVTPRSRCPQCGKQLGNLENIPIVSWLVLRGKCKNCGAPISPRYPLVEALTALLMVAVVLQEEADRSVWLPLVFVLLLVPITFIDFDHRIIPNVLTGLGAVLALAILALTDSDSLVEHLIAGAAAGGFLLLAALAYPAGMGMGDVKLAGVMGLFLGKAVGPAMLIGLLSGTLVGAAIIAKKGSKEGRKTAVPFGPFLAFGSAVAIFAGDAIVDWYTDNFL